MFDRTTSHSIPERGRWNVYNTLIFLFPSLFFFRPVAPLPTCSSSHTFSSRLHLLLGLQQQHCPSHRASCFIAPPLSPHLSQRRASSSTAPRLSLCLPRHLTPPIIARASSSPQVAYRCSSHVKMEEPMKAIFQLLILSRLSLGTFWRGSPNELVAGAHLVASCQDQLLKLLKNLYQT